MGNVVEGTQKPLLEQTLDNLREEINMLYHSIEILKVSVLAMHDYRTSGPEPAPVSNSKVPAQPPQCLTEYFMAEVITLRRYNQDLREIRDGLRTIVG